MRKNILTTIALAAVSILPFCAHSQAMLTDTQREGLKGRVQMIQETTRGSKGQVMRMCTATYFNIIGNYNKVVFEDTTGTPQMEVRYMYDSLGVLAREDRFSSSDSELLLENTYTHDWESHVITMEILGVKDSLSETIVYNFDEKGLLKKVSTIDGQGNLLARDFYSYDDKGQRTEILYTEGSEESYCRTEHLRYDSDGNIIECRTLCISKERQRLCYTYDFDHHGNWVKKYVYDLHDKNVALLQTITREIHYYE